MKNKYTCNAVRRGNKAIVKMGGGWYPAHSVKVKDGTTLIPCRLSRPIKCVAIALNVLHNDF